MKREELEQLIVERLYGEISGADEERLASWLAAHPDDAKEMEELQKTFLLLDQFECQPAERSPIRLPQPLKQDPIPARSSWWKVAAAAVFLIIAAGFWRGVDIQVGTVRLAIGPTAETVQSPVTTDSVRELVKTVNYLNSTNEKFLTKQEAMEQEMYLMKTYLVTGQKLTDEKLKRFTEDLARQIDARMKNYPAYVTFPANLTRTVPAEDGKDKGEMY